jgi:catechol-2,3-dioxygenase
MVTEMPSPKKLAHVVLWSRKVQEMRDWYIKVLGAEVVFENAGGAFLTYDDEHHRIAIANPVAAAALVAEKAGSSQGLVASGSEEQEEPQRPTGPPSRGLAHIAFTFGSLQELLLNFTELKDQSIMPVFSINHGTTTSMYYADPDGNQIELQVDNFESAQEGTEFMMSGSFDSNPIGVPIDPEILIKRLEAGESADELVRPTW